MRARRAAPLCACLRVPTNVLTRNFVSVRLAVVGMAAADPAVMWTDRHDWLATELARGHDAVGSLREQIESGAIDIAAMVRLRDIARTARERECVDCD